MTSDSQLVSSFADAAVTQAKKVYESYIEHCWSYSDCLFAIGFILDMLSDLEEKYNAQGVPRELVREIRSARTDISFLMTKMFSIDLETREARKNILQKYVEEAEA